MKRILSQHDIITSAMKKDEIQRVSGCGRRQSYQVSYSKKKYVNILSMTD